MKDKDLISFMKPHEPWMDVFDWDLVGFFGKAYILIDENGAKIGPYQTYEDMDAAAKLKYNELFEKIVLA